MTTRISPAPQLFRAAAILTHEQTCPDRVADIANAALRDGVIDYPIVLGRAALSTGNKYILLDGHHRLAAVHSRLDLRNIPALVIDYDDDRWVTVHAWRENESVTKKDVIRAAVLGVNMPVKTSRHAFLFEYGPCNFPLEALR